MRNDLSRWTTFGIGGAAKRVEIADSRDRLIDLAPQALVLGRGSNVLVSDAGYDGTVLINRYADVVIDGETATAGSGATLGALCRVLAENSLSGMEWAVGIPGSVGGAVKMNAGAFGGQTADRLMFADVLRGGEIARLSAEELGLSYRHSELADGDTVISATFRLAHADGRSVRARTEKYAAERRRAQPQGKSAGSVFKNPVGMSIGRLIESIGLKGYRVGGAQISQKHANIIINTGAASARDVRAVIDTVKRELGSIGVTPVEEIIYIGDFG
ncbi:MAG: UDP-N-acetylmuramate dehydrogenase [Roseburia sp.]|nr:UDP-N-acetylmuramate dehydrogenase [Roseburia sp.]